MNPRPAYIGAGTRSSPIAIDDSEDEVFFELNDLSNKSSPQNYPQPSLPDDRSNNVGSAAPPAPPMNAFQWPDNSGNIHVDKKRKRVDSFTSQAATVGSTSSTQRQHPTLVNRLSQPESKKSRKRRRKAERQALEEARLRNHNWLNGMPAQQTSLHHSVIPAPSWPMDGLTGPPHATTSYASRNTPDIGDYGAMYRRRLPSPRHTPPPEGDYAPNREVASYRYPYEKIAEAQLSHVPFPSSSSNWVSSMAKAADNPPFNQSAHPGVSQQWTYPPPQPPLPPVSPPPMPPSGPPPNIKPAKVPFPSIAKPQVEHHALPSKPPPAQPVVPIGMKPDQDPNSKHGIFHITSSTREAGTDMKKRSPSYLPNPARTLVLEQLPKTHRHPDFINTWSRSACGAFPVHMFIDSPAGKALVEFATAEQARKAWASPKLGTGYPGLKPHQLKGKPRPDLIKVWWYRVDGVGAGAGVGEIEEGEIEGDPLAEKEVEVTPKKETKKERKARLAKEREEKKQREINARLEKELQDWTKQQQQQQQQQQQAPLVNLTGVQMQMGGVGPSLSAPTPMMPSMYAPQPAPTESYYQSLPSPSRTPPDIMPWPYFLPGWAIPSRSPTPFDGGNNANPAYGTTIQGAMDDQRSTLSPSPGMAPTSAFSSTSGREMRQDIDEQRDDDVVDMEVDNDELSPVVHKPSLPPVNPIHHSLPARPNVVTRSTRPPPPKPPPPPSASAHVFVPRSAQAISTAPQRPSQSIDRKQPQHLPQLSKQQQQPNAPKASLPSQTMAYQNRPAPPHIATPQPKPAPVPSKLSSSDVPLDTPPSSAATAPPTSASTSSSLSSSSSTPVPSEPKAMKNAPTEPSYTKRALMARQKELEEKIAKSKMELAASAAASKTGTPVAPTAPAPAPPQPVKPAMDLGEKQAMEDRLRKLVLQSRKPAQVQAQPSAGAPSNTYASASARATPLSLTTELPQPQAAAAAAEKVTKVEPPPPPPPKSSTVSVSAHSFSLEDMAVSFITQTIETMKSQPTSVPDPAPPAVSAASRAGPDVRSELAAKQKRLEEHITESKLLMAKLSLAKTKEEKDEASLSKNTTSATAYQSKTTTMTTTTTTAQQFRITRWPASREDAGVLILSDDDDDSEEDD
ncbi:hypothetical protein BDN70DRAFT_934620 [Pholiota conissans]|uniref:RRM domain-containing protein n=1 Tax=Pholiota conissans TaxID=109636 RepID=A0A9P5YZL4_9AGAR|nr:hypothetical protein BDN70DRAFT_934620 [Pholiota conissans]